MILNRKLENAINEQIAKEFYASYLYLSMSAYCERRHLSGFSQWMRLQSQEETGHAMKLFDFLLDCGGKVILKEIAAPPSEFNSPLSLAEQALEHEKEVSKSLDALYEMALEEKAFAVQMQLHWFLTEQVEEEKNAGDIVGKLRLINENPSSLLLFDNELGKR